MQKLIYHVAITVDGFLATRDDEVDAFLTEGGHIPDYLASLATYGSVLMGRRTYEFGLALGVTNPYPMLRTFVASKTLAESPDAAVTVIREDIVGTVRGWKAEEGKGIYLCGGGALAGSLFEADLIDEVIVKVNPVVLGDGIPFAAPLSAAHPLRLRSTKVHTAGVIVAHYDVAARPVATEGARAAGD
jgi:dihydrofolate reductase